MTRDEFDAFCGTLPATTHVVQWGASSVWKVGGKIFAICSRWGDGDHSKISFKCSEISYAVLREAPGIVPAPYLARAGWVQLDDPATLSDTDTELYIREAHRIIAGKLTRAKQRELGLTQRDQ
jgi:predicted DNA-binding protein (MmcQ/YjbR family)